MAGIGNIIDIAKLFQDTFGSKPYVVPEVSKTSAPDNGGQYSGIPTKAEQQFTDKGSLIAEQYLGVEIFLPIRFIVGAAVYYFPYCVVSLSRRNSYIKTPMIERRGSVKELFNTDDYAISVKGFLIGQNRLFPEKELQQLKDIVDLKQDIVMDNALTNIFLTYKDASAREQRRVVVEKMELPPVQGGRKHVKPFVLQLESDSVFKLELE